MLDYEDGLFVGFIDWGCPRPKWMNLRFGGGTSGGENQAVATLTRAQKRLQKKYATEYLMPRVGEGLPAYEGPMYEPLTPEQIRLLRQYGQAGAELPMTTAGAFESALRGEVTPGYSPGEIESYLGGVQAPLRRRFEEETIPALREEFRGPGTYWGGVRAKEVGAARERFEEGMTALEAETRWDAKGLEAQLAEAARGRQLQAGTAAGPAFTQAVASALTPEEIKRQDIQRGYDIDFQEYLRTLPETSPINEQILAFLATPMMAVAFEQPTKSKGFLTNLLG